MAEAEQLRNDMNKNHNELKEQNIKQLKEQKEQNYVLTKMIMNLTTHQQKTAEETTQRLNTIEGKQDGFEKRIEKIEQGGTDKGEHSFRGQHMLQIEKPK